jgi:hypothetical protein
MLVQFRAQALARIPPVVVEVSKNIILCEPICDHKNLKKYENPYFESFYVIYY